MKVATFSCVLFFCIVSAHAGYESTFSHDVHDDGPYGSPILLDESKDPSGETYEIVETKLDNGPIPPKQRMSNFVAFYLFPNEWDWEDEHRIITDRPDTLWKSGFNSSLPVTLLIHGILSNRHTILDMRQIKNAYLQARFPSNIIMVDYGKLAVSRLPYAMSKLAVFRAVETMALADRLSDEIVDFIAFLMIQKKFYGPESLHLIGFNTGGVVARRVAKQLFALTHRRTKRVTILEGTETRFRNKFPEKRYADFIDYTVTSQAGLAMTDNDWDAQFYLNGGGLKQPTCQTWMPVGETYCSHTAAIFYFAQSIRRDDIKACKCERTCFRPPKECLHKVTYGQYAPESAKGRFYVKIR